MKCLVQREVILNTANEYYANNVNSSGFLFLKWAEHRNKTETDRWTAMGTTWNVPRLHLDWGSWCPPVVDREQHQEADTTFRRGRGAGREREREYKQNLMSHS